MQKYYPVDVMQKLISLRIRLKRKLTAKDIVKEREVNHDFPSLPTIRRHFGITVKAINIAEEQLASLNNVTNVQKSLFENTTS